MAEEYDEVISKQPRGRLSATEIQRARYGSKLDERRFERWQTVIRAAKFITAIGGASAVLAEILKVLHISF
jgi:hypothetical protein